MKCVLRVALVQTALSLLFIAPLLAQIVSENQRLCIGLAGVTPDQRIAGCTALLEGRDPPPNVPNVERAYIMRALGYEQKGQLGRAIDDYDQYIRLHPTEWYPWAGRCRARTRSGQIDAAFSDCNEALRLHPDDPEVFNTRGFIYLRKGEFDPAIGDFSVVLQRQPKNAGALYGRGTARLASGDNAGGDADIAAAKALEPAIADILAPVLTAPPAAAK